MDIQISNVEFFYEDFFVVGSINLHSQIKQNHTVILSTSNNF